MQRILASLFLALALSGCQAFSDGTRAVQVGTTSEEPFIVTDEPARLGREHFARGNYALAERYFRSAVETVPADGDAWLGLAASYDQLGRFDLADRAYGQATRLKGSSVQLLNNRGFSYLLRGDARSAERMFVRARALDPSNAVVTNNLEILRSPPR